MFNCIKIQKTVNGHIKLPTSATFILPTTLLAYGVLSKNLDYSRTLFFIENSINGRTANP